MELHTAFLLLVAVVTNTFGHPGSDRLAAPAANASPNIVGRATNVLAASVLRANAIEHKNHVFSPLGYAAILAMLSEGARGQTAASLSAAMQHPADTTQVRAAYQTALGHLQGDSASVAPQFKSWLYIYRNNTVAEGFRQTLSSAYHVDVKDIDRYVAADGGEWNEAVGNIDPTVTLGPLGADFEPEASTAAPTIAAASVDPDNSKDIPEFDTLKVNTDRDVNAAIADDATRLIDDQNDASKFDEVVEDKQYVEVPVIRQEIADAAAAAASTNSAAVDRIKQSIIVDNLQYAPESVVLTESLKATKAQIVDEAALEIMQAQESQPAASVVRSSQVARRLRHGAGRLMGLPESGDVASAISGNSIVGERKAGESNSSVSELVLFNGLYYRGSWATPFQRLRAADAAGGNVFYLSDTEKCAVRMMRARGQFRYARLEGEKAQAVELAYENPRYALLIVLPNSRTGLASLQSAWTPDTIDRVHAQLTAQRTIDLSLPKFHAETTGGIETVLRGPSAFDADGASLATIFSADTADFSGISAEQRLHVEELQQHVSVRVDEGASSENGLTATVALRSSTKAGDSEAPGDDSEALSVQVDRPFLFFVRDVIDDVLLVAGKIVSPPKEDAEWPALLDD